MEKISAFSLAVGAPNVFHGNFSSMRFPNADGNFALEHRQLKRTQIFINIFVNQHLVFSSCNIRIYGVNERFCTAFGNISPQIEKRCHPDGHHRQRIGKKGKRTGVRRRVPPFPDKRIFPAGKTISKGQRSKIINGICSLKRGKSSEIRPSNAAETVRIAEMPFCDNKRFAENPIPEGSFEASSANGIIVFKDRAAIYFHGMIPVTVEIGVIVVISRNVLHIMHAAADVCNRSVTAELRTEKVPQIRDQFPMRGKTAFDPVESDVFRIQMMLPTEVIIKFLKRFLQFRRGIRKGNPMFK